MLTWWNEIKCWTQQEILKNERKQSKTKDWKLSGGYNLRGFNLNQVPNIGEKEKKVFIFCCKQPHYQPWHFNILDKENYNTFLCFNNWQKMLKTTPIIGLNNPKTSKLMRTLS
jgi:hypothetical protein